MRKWWTGSRDFEWLSLKSKGCLSVSGDCGEGGNLWGRLQPQPFSTIGEVTNSKITITGEQKGNDFPCKYLADSSRRHISFTRPCDFPISIIWSRRDLEPSCIVYLPPWLASCFLRNSSRAVPDACGIAKCPPPKSSYRLRRGYCCLRRHLFH